MGDTGLLGPERPSPSSVLSLKLKLLAFRVGCCSFSIWPSGSPTWVPGRVWTCSGSARSFSEVSRGLGVLRGHWEGLAPPAVGHACQGHVPWPWVRDSSDSAERVAEQGAYFKELTRRARRPMGRLAGGGKELQFASKGRRRRGLPLPQELGL